MWVTPDLPLTSEGEFPVLDHTGSPPTLRDGDTLVLEGFDLERQVIVARVEKGPGAARRMWAKFTEWMMRL